MSSFYLHAKQGPVVTGNVARFIIDRQMTNVRAEDLRRRDPRWRNNPFAVDVPDSSAIAIFSEASTRQVHRTILRLQ